MKHIHAFVVDRIQENIDRAEDSLAEVEKRLQALFDAQEKEAFVPKEKAMDDNRNTGKRASVKRRLAEKKAETAMRKPPEKEKGRKSPGMDMEK